MKAFREMVTLISKQNLHKIEVIDAGSDMSSDNLYHKLFKGIANGTLATDEDAALAIYKTSPKSKKYQMLKSRLKDRLTNSLFFLNHKKNHDSIYQQSVFICNKNYFCAKILLTHGARTSAVSIARSTLVIAEKFDLNDIVLFCSKILRTHYSMAGLRKEHTHHNFKVNDSIRKITDRKSVV